MSGKLSADMLAVLTRGAELGKTRQRLDRYARWFGRGFVVARDVDQAKGLSQMAWALRCARSYVGGAS